MKIYDLVKCDYHIDGFWVVDAWLPNKEEGSVVAVINDVTGDCYALCMLDDQCKNVIYEKQAEIKNNQSEMERKIKTFITKNLKKTENNIIMEPKREDCSTCRHFKNNFCKKNQTPTNEISWCRCHKNK